MEVAADDLDAQELAVLPDEIVDNEGWRPLRMLGVDRCVISN
jgi:hypothetical protein